MGTPMQGAGSAESRMVQALQTGARIIATTASNPVMALPMALNQAALFGATAIQGAKSDGNLLGNLFGGSGDKAATERNDTPADTQTASTREWCNCKNCSQCGSGCSGGSCPPDIVSSGSANTGEQDDLLSATSLSHNEKQPVAEESAEQLIS